MDYLDLINGYPFSESFRIVSMHYGFSPAHVAPGRVHLPSYYGPCSDIETRRECGYISLDWYQECMT